MELMIPLKAQAGKPMYEQIYEYIKEEIRKGVWPLGPGSLLLGFWQSI